MAAIAILRALYTDHRHQYSRKHPPFGHTLSEDIHPQTLHLCRNKSIDIPYSKIEVFGATSVFNHPSSLYPLPFVWDECPYSFCEWERERRVGGDPKFYGAQTFYEAQNTTEHKYLGNTKFYGAQKFGEYKILGSTNMIVASQLLGPLQGFLDHFKNSRRIGKESDNPRSGRFANENISQLAMDNLPSSTNRSAELGAVDFWTGRAS
jgi:hypothetical protein